jgi:hypothetical protein
MEVLPAFRIFENLPHEIQVRVKCQQKAYRVEDQTREEGGRGLPMDGEGLVSLRM